MPGLALSVKCFAPRYIYNQIIRPEMNSTLPLTTNDVEKSSTYRHVHPCISALWLTLAFVVFTFTWAVYKGGYTNSIPLFALLAIYCYRNTSWDGVNLCVFIFQTVKSNLIHIAHEEKRALTLIGGYWLVKVLLMLWYPNGESSNGSPYSLIFFTCWFITLYIIPFLFSSVLAAVTNCLQVTCLSGNWDREYISKKSVLGVFNHWKRSSLIIASLVLLTYIADSDVLYILRYLGKGQPCWPVLVPSDVRDPLPYPLQHAWIKTWHTVFAGYQPHEVVTIVMLMGREMEVIHVLPMLISLYVFAQVFLPRQNASVKQALFGCIAGVVMSGVCSGGLKMLLHRYRPNAYGNPYMWTGPGSAVVNHLAFSKLDLSFPAGHATVTTSVATCLHQALSRGMPVHNGSNWLRGWMTLLLYFYPMVVLVSRVSDCYHWTSDAVFGVRLFPFCIRS